MGGGRFAPPKSRLSIFHRPLPPSVGETAFPPGPLDSAPPKGGGRLVSTHAALSPELGSSLKARSGRKSGTTAPGVQGAGRGPRRFLWLLSCPRKKVPRLSGRDPTTPPAGCRKMVRGKTPPGGSAKLAKVGPLRPFGPPPLKRGGFGSAGRCRILRRELENSKRKKLFSYRPTGGRRETQS